ncbi:hypothetical protein BDW69DRAFT_15542 [Aspergillus filifer]
MLTRRGSTAREKINKIPTGRIEQIQLGFNSEAAGNGLITGGEGRMKRRGGASFVRSSVRWWADESTRSHNATDAVGSRYPQQLEHLPAANAAIGPGCKEREIAGYQQMYLKVQPLKTGLVLIRDGDRAGAMMSRLSNRDAAGQRSCLIIIDPLYGTSHRGLSYTLILLLGTLYVLGSTMYCRSQQKVNAWLWPLVAALPI